MCTFDLSKSGRGLVVDNNKDSTIFRMIFIDSIDRYKVVYKTNGYSGGVGDKNNVRLSSYINQAKKIYYRSDNQKIKTMDFNDDTEQFNVNFSIVESFVNHQYNETEDYVDATSESLKLYNAFNDNSNETLLKDIRSLIKDINQNLTNNASYHSKRMKKNLRQIIAIIKNNDSTASDMRELYEIFIACINSFWNGIYERHRP